MRDNKNFNALKTLTEVAKLMESSTDRMIRLYDPEFTASGNADERSRRKPDNQLISAMEPQLREQVDQLGRFLKTTPLEFYQGIIPADYNPDAGEIFDDSLLDNAWAALGK